MLKKNFKDKNFFFNTKKLREITKINLKKKHIQMN